MKYFSYRPLLFIIAFKKCPQKSYFFCNIIYSKLYFFLLINFTYCCLSPCNFWYHLVSFNTWRIVIGWTSLLRSSLIVCWDLWGRGNGIIFHDINNIPLFFFCLVNFSEQSDYEAFIALSVLKSFNYTFNGKTTSFHYILIYFFYKIYYYSLLLVYYSLCTS